MKDAALPPPAPDPADEARRLLRRWTGADEGDVLAAVDAIGARAIRAAADAGARLDRASGRGGAEAALGKLETLAADLSPPPPGLRQRLFGRAAPPPADLRRRVAQLVEDFDRELDAVARTAIALAGDRARLDEAAGALAAAAALCRACAKAVGAAERELAPDRPERARFFRDAVQARLAEREGDILAQTAVLQQTILTLGLLAENGDVLARALTRARDISVAALRTAIAARQAIGEGAATRRGAALIDRAADDPDAALRRALADAAGEARRDIGAAGRAAGAPWSTTI